MELLLDPDFDLDFLLLDDLLDAEDRDEDRFPLLLPDLFDFELLEPSSLLRVATFIEL